MNIQKYCRPIFAGLAFLSLALLGAMWFGAEAPALRYALLGLNVAMALAALPASLMMVPVSFAAAHYLEMTPTSDAGIYLQTILLALLGIVQWFWLARFWSPSEGPFQRLDLAGEKL